MDYIHETLLFYTHVRWRQCCLTCFRTQREEIKLFLGIQNRKDPLSAWTEDDWELRLAYLADIFRQLNSLNVELQGKGSLIIDFVEKIKAFVRKLKNWRRKISLGSFCYVGNSIRSYRGMRWRNADFDH